MTNTTNSNKRIAKNTLMLYFRMLFSMGVGFYTSRVVLNTLGVTDFGIYNVVGGIIGMLGFLNGTMAGASSRYIVFYLGKGDSKRLNEVFSTSVNIHLFMAGLILLLGETIGLWYLYNKFQVSVDRFDASFWLYQLSVGSTILTILNVPYNATIIAHEKMSAYAYISLIDIFLKLLIALSLQWMTCDRLIIYGILIFCVQALDFFIYRQYCKSNFKEVIYHRIWDKALTKEMTGFAGWNIFGSLATTCYTQGINLVLNLFFGPTVNAARGIAVQVQGVISQFVWNFQTALNPQITKSYAEKNISRMHNLIYASSKYGFLLLFCMALPVILETHILLKAWLGIVPEYTITFFRIIILISMVDATSNALITSALATGKIKKYQIIVGGILLLILPVSYFVLKLGANPESVFIVNLIFVVIAQVARLWMLRTMIQLSIRIYIKKVIIPILGVSLVACVFPVTLHFYIEESWGRVLLTVFISTISIIFSAVFFGLNSEERMFIQNKIPYLRNYDSIKK